MRQIRRFGILQTAKVVGVLYFIIGLLISIPVGLLSLAAGQPGEGPAPVLMILLFPLLYGVAGFVAVAAACWLYNIVAGRLGGIAIEFNEGNPT